MSNWISRLTNIDTELLLNIFSYIGIGLLYVAIFGFYVAPIFLCYRYAKRNSMYNPGLWAFGGFWLGWIMLLIEVLIYHNSAKRK